MSSWWSSGSAQETLRRRRWLLVIGIVLVVTGRPAAAFAHGGTDQAGFTNYESTIVAVTPNVPGLEVSTYGVNGGIKVSSTSNRDVIILGYDNEPFLKINRTGTYANLNSPATYLNLSADANVEVPEQATSSTEPNWQQLSYGDTVWWNDHRAHWMGTLPPDVVQADPSVAHTVYEAWTVPILVGNDTATITGQLRWVPPPDRTRWLLIAGAFFVAALLIMHLLQPVRPIATLALLAGLVGNIMVATSRATVERATSAERVTCFITAGIVALLFVFGLPSHLRTGPPLLWGLAGGVLTGTAIAYLKVFNFAVMDGGSPTDSMRWAVALELAMGAAVAAEAIIGVFTRALQKRENRRLAELRAAEERELEAAKARAAAASAE